MSIQDDQQRLSILRQEIDEIDEAMHRLLMKRGTIIDQLVAAKAATKRKGLAFRPGREAAMMRHIVSRHRSAFPIQAVEHIWRAIISTFTYLQSPYKVYADCADSAFVMHDMARFHFGFSVELVMEQGPARIIDQVRSSGRDLGLIALKREEMRGAWWRELATDNSVSIVAVLPFILTKGQNFNTPCCVVAPLLSGAVEPERKVVSCRASASLPQVRQSLDQVRGLHLLAGTPHSGDEAKSELLLSVSAHENLDQVQDSGLILEECVQVGTVAEPVKFEENVVS